MFWHKVKKAFYLIFLQLVIDSRYPLYTTGSVVKQGIETKIMPVKINLEQKQNIKKLHKMFLSKPYGNQRVIGVC